MVAVVFLFQPFVALLFGEAVGGGDFSHTLIEILMKFSFTETADIGILRQHRDINEVVESAENAQVGELGDTGKHGETDVLVAALDVGIKGFEDLAIFLLELGISDGFQQRFVVFVDEDDHFPFGRLSGSVCNHIAKSGRDVFAFFLNAEFFFPFGKKHANQTSKRFGCGV